MSHLEEGRKFKKSKTDKEFIDVNLVDHVVGAVAILNDDEGTMLKLDSTQRLRVYISKNRKPSDIKCS